MNLYSQWLSLELVMGELRVKLNSARSLRNSSSLLNNANALLDRTRIPMLSILYNVLFFILNDLVEVGHTLCCCNTNCETQYQFAAAESNSNQNSLYKRTICTINCH